MHDTHPGDDLVALALDDLDPATRSVTVAHMSTCPQCREEYDAIAAAIENTLVAAPAVGPPPGFEERVLAALGVQASAGRHRRLHWMLVAASVVVGLALGAGATYTLDQRSTSRSASAPFHGSSPGAKLSKIDGTVVGAVTPSFVGAKRVYIVRVRTGPVGMRYVCELYLPDGSKVSGGRWQLSEQPAIWVVPAPSAQVAELVLVAHDGKGPVWSRADL